MDLSKSLSSTKEQNPDACQSPHLSVQGQSMFLPNQTSSFAGHPFHGSISFLSHQFSAIFLWYTKKLVDKRTPLPENLGDFLRPLWAKQLSMKSYNHMRSWLTKVLEKLGSGATWQLLLPNGFSGVACTKRYTLSKGQVLTGNGSVHTCPIGFVLKKQRMITWITWKCLSWFSIPFVSLESNLVWKIRNRDVNRPMTAGEFCSNLQSWP